MLKTCSFTLIHLSFCHIFTSHFLRHISLKACKTVAHALQKYVVVCFSNIPSSDGQKLYVQETHGYSTFLPIRENVCDHHCCDLFRSNCQSSNYADIMNVRSTLGLSITLAVTV